MTDAKPYSNGNVLAEREIAGVHVSLAWLPNKDMTVIQVWRWDDEEQDTITRSCHVPPEDAWDAFQHPCAYLTDPEPFA
jgi:hypothetical protein